jgi:aspartyl-tRNA(Asn)/glutamyl-tRNA(Gln) amidotransferase subunit A
VRTLIRRDFERPSRHCDALLTPVAPTPAYRVGEKTDDPMQMYLGDIFTVTANLAGICGLSVPCGLTAAGLPVGLQILGPAFGEETVLRWATPTSRRRTGIAAPPADSRDFTEEVMEYESTSDWKRTCS